MQRYVKGFNIINSQIVMNCYFHISFLKIYYAAAVVCWGEGEPWKVEEIQVEPPKATEVRVKMLYASICHTDVLSSKGFPLVSITSLA